MPRKTTPAQSSPRKVVKPAAKRATVPATTSLPATTSATTKASKKHKAGKESKKPAEAAKVVRDSFTMPAHEYELIGAIKKRCIAQGFAAKKSEVLRAAVHLLAAQSDRKIKAALQSLEAIKTGRPPKGKK